ncbi:MAG TPA: dNTP triphosphohydrolase [Bacteroidota bacterium]|nr:dNTP triphosphohydrolase [Bacteroidota bacterium]
MENRFYNDFDTLCLTKRRTPDYRSPFETDRDRIIHTSAFRRLQAKTQVFLSGEYDFYRTRLTHSLEVAQIGRSICKFLRHNSPLLSPEFTIDSNLVEAICLSHDLGHPPFGHSGERTLNELMKPYGGFEGNAQTLRLITETIYSSGGTRQGMNPTRAFLDGILKYKVPNGEFENPENHFIYDEQRNFVEFVFDGTLAAGDFPDRKMLNSFRSIECQIMDWSDDAAYSLNDLADGIHSGIINKEKIEQWGSERTLSAVQSRSLEQILAAITAKKLEKTVAGKIGEFIQACSLSEWKNFMSGKTNRYRFQLRIDSAVLQEAELYKRISVDLVFRSPQLHQLEHKGGYILKKIFTAFQENYLQKANSKTNLLPHDTEQRVRAAAAPGERMRLLCDHIAGMTDGFAVRTYKRLFDAEFGSLADLV